jgi:hypothetical protein
MPRGDESKRKFDEGRFVGFGGEGATGVRSRA